IVKYHVVDQSPDPAHSGHFLLNGVAQANNTVKNGRAARRAQLTYQGGVTAGDIIGVQANDGLDWGAFTYFSVSPSINHLPVVTATAPLITESERGHVYATSVLFSVSDADSDSIVKYHVVDQSPDPAHSGHFLLNGVAQANNTV